VTAPRPPRAPTSRGRASQDPGGSAPAFHATAFAALWAVGHLAHAFRKEPVTDALSWLLLLACALVLHRPSSPGRLGVLAVAQIALFADRMPKTDNHLYILAFANAGLLVTALPLALRGRGWDRASFGLARTWAAVVFLVSYGAAALSKLNRDFLFAEDTCALALLDDAAAAVGSDRALVPEALQAAVPFVVAGVELAVPVLLALRATRAAGVVLAVLFHLAISISPTATAVDFTVLIFAVLALFVPLGGAAGRPVRRLAARLRAGLREGRRRGLRPALDWDTAALLGLFAALVVFQWRLGTVAGNRSWAVNAPLALLLGAALVWAAVRLRGAPDRFRVSLRPLRAPHYGLLALLVLNAAAPYLGWKTDGTFTMYSNLDTYAGESNHYLFPRVGSGTPHDDLVRVVATSSDRLGAYVGSDLLLTWHQLRRALARDPEASVTYVRGGRTYAYDRAAENPELVSTDPVLHKLLSHRPHVEGPSRCMW
jgi:hypothetical protein